MTQVNRNYAKSAAKTFSELTPEYIACPENARIMEAEISRLAQEEGRPPEDIRTFCTAFRNLRDQLRLNETPVQKPHSDMTVEELFSLPDSEKDNLSTSDLKRLAEYELKRRQIKPEIDESEALVRQLFNDEGLASSPENRQIVSRWLQERSLDFSPSNITKGIEECDELLEPSEEFISRMSADQYKRIVVDPTLRKQQASQPQRERNWPVGIRYTSWLHNQ